MSLARNVLALAVLALSTPAGCAYSSYQSAKMLPAGATRVGGALNNYGYYESGDNVSTGGIEAMVSHGVSDSFALGGKLAWSNQMDVNAFNILVAPKLSLKPDVLAFTAQSGIVLFSGDGSSENIWSTMPGVVFTHSFTSKLDLDVAGKLVLMFSDNFDDHNVAGSPRCRRGRSGPRSASCTTTTAARAAVTAGTSCNSGWGSSTRSAPPLRRSPPRLPRRRPARRRRRRQCPQPRRIRRRLIRGLRSRDLGARYSSAMTVPEPPPPSLADRFWSHAPGPETEDLSEPDRSAAVVRNFLTALDHVEQGPMLATMLRRAEVEGDLSYASPEQLRGETLDARSIIFSLGVVLFERLTGRHPFGGENNRPRRLDRIRRGEMGSGVNVFPTIQSAVRSVLVRAMSPFAEERWTDLAEFRKALSHLTHAPPAPKLPGASPDDEETKVVRSPTEFGQELMRVVDDHPTTQAAAEARRVVARARAARGSAAPPGGVAGSSATPLPVAASAPTPPAAEASMRPVARTSPPAGPAFPVASRDELPRFPSEARARPAAAGSRAAVIAIAGAAVGAAATLAVVFAMRRGDATNAAPGPTAGTASSGSRPEPAVAPPVRVAFVDEPEASPVAAPGPDAAANPSPSAPDAAGAAPAAAGGGINEQLASAIASCLRPTPPMRVIGLSIVYRAGVAGKTYFAANDPLSVAERGCISAGIRGLTAADAPPSGDIQYRIRGGSSGVTIQARRPR
jgi:serine/threonine protein kinase